MSSIVGLSNFFKLPKLHEGAGGGSATVPFEISATANGSNVIISLGYGTVNNVIPANINTTFTISNNVTRYVVIDCNMSQGQVSSCNWALDTTSPSPPNVQISTPPSTCKVNIGIIVNGTVFKLFPDYNVSIRAMEAYRAAKASPIPLNEIPFDLYFTYIIMAASSVF